MGLWHPIHRGAEKRAVTLAEERSHVVETGHQVALRSTKPPKFPACYCDRH